MKKQSAKAKLDEHLGAKHGAEKKHKESMKARRHESEAMDHHDHLKAAHKHLLHASKMMKKK